MFDIQITSTAEKDIIEAADWWSQYHSPEQAVRWYRNIYLAINTLREMPERCPIARESIDYKLTVHQLLFGTGRHPTHRILFDVDDKTVRIWRVVHTSQDEFDLNTPD